MRTRLRLQRFAVAALLGAGLLVAAPGSAVAAGTGPAACVLTGSAAGKDVNSDTVVTEIQSLEDQGMTSDAINSVLARDWCLVKVSQPDPNAQPNGADKTDVSWQYAEIYWSYTKHHFFAASKYSWRNHDWASDASIFTSCRYSSAVGGNEGAGLRLSGGEYAMYGQTLYIGGDPAMDQYGNSYSDYKHIAATDTLDQYGVGFAWQDNTRETTFLLLCQDGDDTMDYDSYKGWLAMEFAPLQGFNCQQRGQVFTDYWHTWDSGAINGFDISATSFGAQWQVSSQGFHEPLGGEIWNMCYYG